jgi:hypothetical protein
LVEDRAGEPLVAALWDIVEDWSSTAIQRTREATATGPTDVLDAEIRLLIAHAAQLRGVIEAHLEGDDAGQEPVAETPSGPEDPAEVLARLHEVPLAEVCPECFTVVRLDELEAHDLVCVRHKAIEKMDRDLEDDLEDGLEPEVEVEVEPESGVEPEPEEQPAAEAEQPEPEPEVDEPEADEPEAQQAAPDHTCNSADFERPLCDSCGGLHWYCSICGAQRDACRPVAAAATS